MIVTKSSIYLTIHSKIPQNLSKVNYSDISKTFPFMSDKPINTGEVKSNQSPSN